MWSIIGHPLESELGEEGVPVDAQSVADSDGPNLPVLNHPVDGTLGDSENVIGNLRDGEESGKVLDALRLVFHVVLQTTQLLVFSPGLWRTIPRR